MEMYLYRCPKCGFAHQVPAYWMSYAAEDIYEMPHNNLATKELCENLELQLVKEE